MYLTDRYPTYARGIIPDDFIMQCIFCIFYWCLAFYYGMCFQANTSRSLQYFMNTWLVGQAV